MQIPLRALQHVSVMPEGSGGALWHRGVILDIEEGAGLLVSIPEGALGRRVSELDDEPAARTVLLESPTPNGVYRFHCEVRGRLRSDPTSWRLDWPSRVERIQRREYVRVPVRLPVEVRFQVEEEPRQLAGTTVDLSAGGVRLRLAEPVPAETRVDTSLDIPDLGPRAYGGTVVRSEPAAGAASGQHLVGVRFEELGAAVRNRIVQYVFSVQRDQMRWTAR